jgi:hypothetical protein
MRPLGREALAPAAEQPALEAFDLRPGTPEEKNIDVQGQDTPAATRNRGIRFSNPDIRINIADIRV